MVLPMAVGFALCFSGVWLSRSITLPVVPEWSPLILLPVGLFVCAWAYLGRWSTRYVFTTKAVYEKTGLFSRTVTRVSLDRVQNTAIDQSPLERLLSYGNLAVYTAGSGGVDLRLWAVPDPGGVNALVTAQLGKQSVQSTTERPATRDRATL